ncbi:helix-turn-helix domain-containing protein [Rubidibacter lacunae]|uniref:helix-turn-helix domain-containing protein n=1 Tax=Rubidibacter lacunae TaxID=582514 RepID=UPI0018DB0B6B|nr:transposase family protein [Rubidibacter lacunae]
MEKLFFIWFYFKVYPTFDLAGFLFDLDRSQANRWMHRLKPLLADALGAELALPKRKLTSIEEFVLAFPEVKQVILEGTEHPV